MGCRVCREGGLRDGGGGRGGEEGVGVRDGRRCGGEGIGGRGSVLLLFGARLASSLGLFGEGQGLAFGAEGLGIWAEV